MANVYRKSSIEKLANPEQLDKAVTISSPLSWLALVGLALAIAVGLAWAVWGTLPTTVTAQGVMAGAVDSCAIYAEWGGVVAQVLKQPGDAVAPGDKVASIRLGDGQEKDVLAPGGGTVSSVLAQEGGQALSGDELFRYTPETGLEQVAVCYVPSGEAASLRPGMKVLLYQTASGQQGGGHIEGEVAAVGAFPANLTNMAYVLGSGNQLAEQVAAQGPVTAVACRLREDPSAPGGYSWAGAKAQSGALPNGTPLTVKIVTAENAPLAKLLGGLKDK